MANWFGDAKRGRIASFFGNRPTMAAYWQLNGSSQDNSGGSNTGTDTNIVYGAKGQFGKCAYQNQNGYITFGNPLNGATKYTLMAWCYITAIPSNSPQVAVILSTTQSDSNATTADLNVYYGGSITRFRIRDGAGEEIASGAPLSLNKWHFVVGTYDGANQKLFIDGILVGVHALTGATLGSYNGSIGAYSANSAGTTYNIPGYIEETAMFNEAIPDAIIAQYYAWAMKKKMGIWKRVANAAQAFTRALTDSIMVAASRLTVLTYAQTLARALSDSIMNAASRLATVGKGTVSALSDSIMNAANRFTVLTWSAIHHYTTAISDSIMNAASRLTSLTFASSALVFMNKAANAVMSNVSKATEATFKYLQKKSDEPSGFQ